MQEMKQLEKRQRELDTELERKRREIESKRRGKKRKKYRFLKMLHVKKRPRDAELEECHKTQKDKKDLLTKNAQLRTARSKGVLNPLFALFHEHVPFEIAKIIHQLCDFLYCTACKEMCTRKLGCLMCQLKGGQEKDIWWSPARPLTVQWWRTKGEVDFSGCMNPEDSCIAKQILRIQKLLWSEYMNEPMSKSQQTKLDVVKKTGARARTTWRVNGFLLRFTQQYKDVESEDDGRNRYDKFVLGVVSVISSDFFS